MEEQNQEKGSGWLLGLMIGASDEEASVGTATVNRIKRDLESTFARADAEEKDGALRFSMAADEVAEECQNMKELLSAIAAFIQQGEDSNKEGEYRIAVDDVEQLDSVLEGMNSLLDLFEERGKQMLQDVVNTYGPQVRRKKFLGIF